MSAPLAMDIMTERHDVANRLQKALIGTPEVFGSLRDDGGEPAIHIRSVHHLCKTVNGRPLMRPAWYFDVAAQGEGITDVTTHLVDLAQWMVGGEAYHYARDIELLAARQWPTEVPRAAFARITGLADFPETLRAHVSGGTLHLLCNASIDFRLRGVPVRIESLWELEPFEGGGDTHYALVRGTGAQVVIEQNAGTAFVPELFVRLPSERAGALAGAVASLRSAYPDLEMEGGKNGYRVAIPAALRTTHEQHFARVLDRFLACIDGEAPPGNTAADLVARYTLLARAAELSHRA
jgi:predicted dehydrogenase